MAAGSSGANAGNLNVRVTADVAAALVGFATLQGAISMVVDQVKQFIVSGIQMNSFLESSELQFKTLTGSAGAAHEQVKMLFDLAAHTPFTFESVTVASRQLEVFGGRTLDTRDNLVMLGDAAAATSAPIEQVTFWTGRLYSALQAGEPIGMATMWLQRMGVLSAEATQRMKALSDQGASADEVWGAFSESMQRFGGAMKEQEGTWKGLTSTMQDTFTLIEGVSTRGLFKDLESQIKAMNLALGSPQAQQQAEATGQLIQLLAHEGEGLGRAIAETAPAFNVAATAMALYTDQTKEAWAASLEMEGAERTIASVMEAGTGKIQQATDAGGALATVMHAGADAGVRQIQVFDTLAGSYETLANAEKQRLFDQGQALANAAGNPTQEEIIFKARAEMAANAAAAEKRNAEQAARNQEDAAREAARVITEQNAETQRKIAEQTRAAQEAVRRAYDETADEAVAQYQRIANAAAPVVDTLQQQIDEAINRQVREGTEGTADAEKQLDDIRKAHLATLPNLIALDKQYADAQQDARAADLAVAAAQRNLAVALAASGGQQTIRTAALSHGVTAAKQAAAAAHDHASALAAERGQAISDTNALRGLAAQRSSMGGAAGGGLDLMDTGSQAGRTRIYGHELVHPTVVQRTTNLTINGNVTTTQADFERSVVNAVQQADKSGGLNLTRYAAR